jgi:hypothetical protein
MELLLNLSWLLLAMPAYWLWRASTRRSGRFLALQSVFALACVLVILFPVVSATDDLRVMRAEMEESPTSKHSVCQSSGGKAPAWKSQPQPALTVAVRIPVSLEHGFLVTAEAPVSTPPSLALTRAGRAPPRPSNS